MDGITFLIPTRNRFDDLLDSLKQIYIKAFNKDIVYVIVTIYKDDEITLNNIKKIKEVHKNITVLIFI